MQRSNSGPNGAKERFWGQYIQYLIDQGVKPSVTRWYVIRIEQYIKAFPGKRISEHQPEDVARYLEEQGRQGNVEDWQFRQIVDAMQNLFAMLKISWLSKVDWQFWMDSSLSLPESHSTIARDVSAEETINTDFHGK